MLGSALIADWFMSTDCPEPAFAVAQTLAATGNTVRIGMVYQSEMNQEFKKINKLSCNTGSVAHVV